MTDNGNTAGPSATISPVATMNEFSRWIAEAAKAMERIPQLEYQVQDALNAREIAQEHSLALELRIREVNDSHDSMLNRLAEVERERDTFRDQALNAANDRDRIISSIETAISMVQDDIRVVAPPAPQEPEAGPSPVTTVEPVASASTTAPVAPSDPDPSQKYAGRIYADYDHYVPYQE